MSLPPPSAKERQDTLLQGMPANILFDIARNESADPEYRKAAVKIMRRKKFPKTDHPDLAQIVRDIEKEELAEKEVISIVESAIEADLDVTHPDD